MVQHTLPGCFSGTLVNQAVTESIYYSREWCNFIASFYGYTFVPLTVTNDAGQIAGFLPLCHIRSAITGPRLVAFPFSDHCPLVAEDEVSAQRLIDEAVQLARQERVRYLELRTGLNSTLAGRSDFVEGNLYVSWQTTLTSDLAVMWSRLRGPVRKKIRKSRRLGVQIRRAQRREDMQEYYRLHLRTRSKKHGMPAQSQQFFLDLWDIFAASGALQLFLADYEGTTIAGTVMIGSGTTARILYGASDGRYLHLAPNNLLMWEAIVWCCQQGYQTLEHGRTARANEGLMKFKEGWAAIEKPLPYYYYPDIAGLAATSERSRLYKLLTSCWKRVPLALAGPLGGSLYRHLG